MEKNIIFFDLDGTLTDPMLGITRSVQHALKAYGVIEEDLTRLIPFIGPPLKDSFMKFYDFSEEQAKEAIYKYREYFATSGLFENRVYEGIPEMLGKLKASGKKLYVATSKPEKFARQILEHFQLDSYFDYIGGASMDEVRVMVMVGDREHDVFGAKEQGIDCVGVLFGYGSREELEAAGTWKIAADMDELTKIIMEDL